MTHATDASARATKLLRPRLLRMRFVGAIPLVRCGKCTSITCPLFPLLFIRSTPLCRLIYYGFDFIDFISVDICSVFVLLYENALGQTWTFNISDIFGRFSAQICSPLTSLNPETPPQKQGWTLWHKGQSTTLKSRGGHYGTRATSEAEKLEFT